MFNTKFELLTDDLNNFPQTDWFDFPTAGAAVTFEGRVRNHSDGKNVSYLEYLTYQEMALIEGANVVSEALAKFDITDAKCMHRHGKLNIGDIAVWVVAVSSHRREAFEACQYIIDQIKNRLPMWKKEFYTDESSIWVNCHRCTENSHDE